MPSKNSACWCRRQRAALIPCAELPGESQTHWVALGELPSASLFCRRSPWSPRSVAGGMRSVLEDPEEESLCPQGQVSISSSISVRVLFPRPSRWPKEGESGPAAGRTSTGLERRDPRPVPTLATRVPFQMVSAIKGLTQGNSRNTADKLSSCASSSYK